MWSVWALIDCSFRFENVISRLMMLWYRIDCHWEALPLTSKRKRVSLEVQHQLCQWPRQAYQTRGMRHHDKQWIFAAVKRQTTSVMAFHFHQRQKGFKKCGIRCLLETIDHCLPLSLLSVALFVCSGNGALIQCLLWQSLVGTFLPRMRLENWRKSCLSICAAANPLTI